MLWSVLGWCGKKVCKKNRKLYILASVHLVKFKLCTVIEALSVIIITVYVYNALNQSLALAEY